MTDPAWRGWADNVAKRLIAERDEAEARYVREHRRAVFMASCLQNAWEALPDYVGRTPNPERALKAIEDVGNAVAPWVNAFAEDVSWVDQDYDFGEWERDYFGPKPEQAPHDADPRRESA